MQDSNILVDRKALEMSRNRVIGRDECFLYDLVISEIKDRIQNINRDFQLIAIVTGLPAPWRKAFPKATIIEDKEKLSQYMRTGMVQRHIGIYGFRISGLRTFVGLGESHLERIEKLEQLRWIEAGKDLLVLKLNESVPGGVDTPADLRRIRDHFASS